MLSLEFAVCRANIFLPGWHISIQALVEMLQTVFVNRAITILHQNMFCIHRKDRNRLCLLTFLDRLSLSTFISHLIRS